MRTIATALVALGLLTGVASARPVDSYFTGLDRTAPRSLFDGIQDAAPRSVFDDINATAPRSPFDQLNDTAPLSSGDNGVTSQDHTGE